MKLKINNMSFKYSPASDYIFKNFSHEFESNKISAIMGDSGCGKTTLLRLIAGFECPEEGLIQIGDKIVVNNKTFVKPEKRKIGIVPQDYSLFPHLTVIQNIEFGLSKLKKELRKIRSNEMLSIINMAKYANRYPHELSGGQQQRVALARAIAIKPDLLLMDEPFSNLNNDLKNEIKYEIKSIIQKAESTCIFVTHAEDDLQDFAESCLKL